MVLNVTNWERVDGRSYWLFAIHCARIDDVPCVTNQDQKVFTYQLRRFVLGFSGFRGIMAARLVVLHVVYNENTFPVLELD